MWDMFPPVYCQIAVLPPPLLKAIGKKIVCGIHVQNTSNIKYICAAFPFSTYAYACMFIIMLKFCYIAIYYRLIILLFLEIVQPFSLRKRLTTSVYHSVYHPRRVVLEA